MNRFRSDWNDCFMWDGQRLELMRELRLKENNFSFFVSAIFRFLLIIIHRTLLRMKRKTTLQTKQTKTEGKKNYRLITEAVKV